MMSEFFGSFLTPSLPLVRILFTNPLLVKSEFHGPTPSQCVAIFRKLCIECQEYSPMHAHNIWSL